MPVFRTDRSTLRAPQTLADGSVIVEAVLARAGTQSYRNDDGSERIEYRDPSEVFAPEAMKSFELMAVTDYHPPHDPVHGQAVTIDNRTALQRGSVVPGSLRRDTEDGAEVLIGKLHITDKNLIGAMRGGRNQISCGYYQSTIKQPGITADGKPYHVRQEDIRGNHVAVVDDARAGAVAHARMDQADVERKRQMFKTIEEATAAYQAEKLRADQASEALTSKATFAKAETLRADQAEAARDTATDKLKTAEALRVDGETKGLEAARARVKLEDIAAKILTVDGEAPKFTRADTDTSIRKRVIERVFGAAVPVGKSEGYIEARYDSAIEKVTEGDGGMASVRTAVDDPDLGTGMRADAASSGGASQKAYAEMVARQANQWKTKPTTAKGA